MLINKEKMFPLFSIPLKLVFRYRALQVCAVGQNVIANCTVLADYMPFA